MVKRLNGLILYVNKFPMTPYDTFTLCGVCARLLRGSSQ